MEDKMFDLLSKIYGEFSEFRKETHARFDGLESKVDGLDAKVTRIDSRLTKVEAVIENDIKPDMKALYQNQVQISKKLEEHDERFDKIETKLENMQIEINSNSSKSKRHSYEIGALKREKKVK